MNLSIYLSKKITKINFEKHTHTFCVTDIFLYCIHVKLLELCGFLWDLFMYPFKLRPDGLEVVDKKWLMDVVHVFDGQTTCCARRWWCFFRGGLGFG